MNINEWFDNRPERYTADKRRLRLFELQPSDGVVNYGLYLLLGVLIAGCDALLLWLAIKGLLHGHFLLLLWLAVLFIPVPETIIVFSSLRLIWIGTFILDGVKWAFRKAGYLLEIKIDRICSTTRLPFYTSRNYKDFEVRFRRADLVNGVVPTNLTNFDLTHILIRLLNHVGLDKVPCKVGINGETRPPAIDFTIDKPDGTRVGIRIDFDFTCLISIDDNPYYADVPLLSASIGPIVEAIDTRWGANGKPFLFTNPLFQTNAETLFFENGECLV